ncbi:hypothetical protein E2K99_02010 [Herbaspirillum huttiense]|uniref:hypothetical protein n=1 Tax=Herbaspirillum huttiense TaxID=863372 RepID=UPI0010650289|nr:hypothetical protein [Herbaspirillum huttiense]QBP73858.1 hypothetical protein E2K99_02010 [Herbaspirillum huttiense]
MTPVHSAVSIYKFYSSNKSTSKKSLPSAKEDKAARQRTVSAYGTGIGEADLLEWLLTMNRIG